MPNILLNELSAVAQAAYPVHADEYMRDLAATYEALKPISYGGALYRHSTFGTCRLTPSMTVYEWLRRAQTGKMRTVQRLLLEVVTKRPKIDTWLAEHAPHHMCQRRHMGNVVQQAFSSLAGAAHMGGWVLSIRQCIDFPYGPIEVDYSADGTAPRTMVLEHFIEPAEAISRRRIYEASDKHPATPTQNNGVPIAPMDLQPAEAQEALDWAQAIPDEKRIFGRQGHKIYVFFEHTTRHYHGYLLEDPQEYQSRDARIYNHLKSWGWIKS